MKLVVLLIGAGLLLTSSVAVSDDEPRWALMLEVPFGAVFAENGLTKHQRVGLSHEATGRRHLGEGASIGARYLYLTGAGSHHGEFGMGIRRDLERHEQFGELLVAYRFESPAGGLQLRTGASASP